MLSNEIWERFGGKLNDITIKMGDTKNERWYVGMCRGVRTGEPLQVKFEIHTQPWRGDFDKGGL